MSPPKDDSRVCERPNHAGDRLVGRRGRRKPKGLDARPTECYFVVTPSRNRSITKSVSMISFIYQIHPKKFSTHCTTETGKCQARLGVPRRWIRLE